MKLIAVLGSNRPHSVSTQLAERVMEGAKDAGCEVIVYNINELNVKGCEGCGVCRKKGVDCIVKDDLQDYFKELHTCDALLVTSPNYCSQVTGPMITFMNRHYCLSNADRTSRLASGKKLIGIFAQGAPEEMDRYQQNYDWYLRNFQRHMELIGKIVVGGNSDLSADGKIMTEAYELGRSIGKQ